MLFYDILYLSMKKERRVKKRHTFFMNLIKILLRPFAFFVWGYRYHSRYKIKKGEKVLVLSNHQTDFDPLIIHLSFNKLLHTLATDNIFKKGIANWFLKGMGCIPKRKGLVDFKSVMEMNAVLKEGGNVLFFPEGNRTYAEFQYYINPKIGQFVKASGATLILFNIHGGTGKYPRFKNKARRGKFYGEIKKVLTPDEYKDMSDEELYKIIRDNLRVFDSDSGNLYKSSRRAEYMERMFFVCPVCGKAEMLHSHKQYIHCDNCGLKVEYTEDMLLKSDDEGFKFNRTIDWYEYQKQWVRDYVVKEGEVIFQDDNVVLSTRTPYQPIEELSRGKMVLTDKELIVGDVKFSLKEIDVASPLKGNRLLFSVNGKGYHIQGHPRFNPIKYVFMLNKLDTKIKEMGIDKMFAL